jgi:hypothetical protein
MLRGNLHLKLGEASWIFPIGQIKTPFARNPISKLSKLSDKQSA